MSEPETLDLIWGAEDIGALIGKSRQQTFYLLEKGLIPARNIKTPGKSRGQWVASRRKLMAFFEGEAA
ncbi:hypothetical protein ABIB57_003652 [Devosia sp. UYZn731]|uniref:DNA-binding protein n=1 Tax=Devosia sp. UYZn731 TaxID=3156345 RepID=UPI00339B7957